MNDTDDLQIIIHDTTPLATEETLAEIASTVITGTSESSDTSINIQ